MIRVVHVEVVKKSGVPMTIASALSLFKFFIAVTKLSDLCTFFLVRKLVFFEFQLSAYAK